MLAKHVDTPGVVPQATEDQRTVFSLHPTEAELVNIRPPEYFFKSLRIIIKSCEEYSFLQSGDFITTTDITLASKGAAKSL